MSNILILDDDPDRHRWFARHYTESGDNRVVSTSRVDEFARRLLADRWDIVHLDFDLHMFSDDYERDEAGRPLSGMDAARHLQRLPEWRRPRVIIHSINEAGAREIRESFQPGWSVEVRPFRRRA